MFNGRRQPSCGGTSRMTRECQVRICERLGVQFPGPTRQWLYFASVSMSGLPPRAVPPEPLLSPACSGCYPRVFSAGTVRTLALV